MSGSSVWDGIFDFNSLLALSVKIFTSEFATGINNSNANISMGIFESERDTNPNCNSNDLVDAFYDPLEESLRKQPSLFDSPDSYQDYEFRQQLLANIMKLRNNKISLSNFSHLQYLLPWDLQPSIKKNSNKSANKNSSQTLKNALKTEISQAKLTSQAIKRHYLLRFTGQAILNHKKGICWDFLAKSYRDKSMVEITVYIKKLLKFQGQILLFDSHCNLFLGINDFPGWVYIDGPSVCLMRKI